MGFPKLGRVLYSGMGYLIETCQPGVLCLTCEGEQEPPPACPPGREGGTRAAGRRGARREGPAHPGHGGAEAPQVRPSRLSLQPGRTSRVGVPLGGGGGTDAGGASAGSRCRTGGSSGTAVPTISARARSARTTGDEAGGTDRSAWSQLVGGISAGRSCCPGGPSRAKGTARGGPGLSGRRRGLRPRRGKAFLGRASSLGSWRTDARCSRWGIGSSG